MEPSYIHRTEFISESISFMCPDPLGASYVPTVTSSADETMSLSTCRTELNFSVFLTFFFKL